MCYGDKSSKKKKNKLSGNLVSLNSSTIVDGDSMNPNLSLPPGPGPGIPMPSGPPMSGGVLPSGPQGPMHGGPQGPMHGGPQGPMHGGPQGPMHGGPQGPMHGGPPGPQGGPMMGGIPMQMSGPGGPMPPGMMQGVPGPMMGGPMSNQDPFYTSPFSNFYRRPTPYVGQPDYRIYELNKRLQQRSEDSDNLWWDNFTTEFFEDDAQLTLTFCLEDGPKRYTIGRTLIPRYFRSIFEGGVTDLHYLLKYPKESFHNTTITLDCDHAFMITQHGKPMFTNQVVTEGRLLLEYTFDDLMRIRSWHFAIRQHRELIPRNVIAMQDPAMVEQLSKNITRMGLTSCTLNFLRLCVILEPMQELMSRHKAYGLNPRDCLKTTLFQKWQRMVAPPGKETSRPPSKRRKRKGSASNNAGGNVNNRDTPSAGKKRSPGPQGFNLGSTVPGDVMVVGEPTLMGGEFGDEDERLITRLENSQFEPTNNDETNVDKFHNSPAMQQNSWGGDKNNSQPSTISTTPTTNTPLTEADIKQE